VRLALADDHALDEKANLRAHHASLREWQRSAPLLSAWRGPGNHYTILKQPHVGMLANWWREIL
jgi:thioesterase domain-containing protein